MSRPRVFIDGTCLATPNISGIGHTALEITRALAAHRDIETVLLIPLGKKSTVEKHNIDGIKTKTMPFTKKMIALVNRSRFFPPMDLFIGKGVYLFPDYSNWPLLSSKSITYIHDMAYELYPETLAPKNLSYIKNNIKVWVRRTDLIVTVSKSSKNDILDKLKVSSDKVKVVYNGVDHSVFYRRTKNEIETAKEKYGIESKYIIYVGNFEPRKNLPALVDAYIKLPHKHTSKYALLLVGSGGWLSEDIENTIKKSQESGFNIITPKSRVTDEDLPAIYSGASVLVHPAIYEGFGLTLLQAMACGTPVIAANNSSLPEVVGNAGLLIDCKNDTPIVKAITDVLENKSLRQKIIAAGNLQSKKMTWDKTATELANLIKNIT
ncbi:MAG: glycosyltransferase family 1 protein [bacterium]